MLLDTGNGPDVTTRRTGQCGTNSKTLLFLLIHFAKWFHNTFTH